MGTDNPSVVPVSTIRTDEVDRFNRLAAIWWNSAGPMRPLHVINGLRLGYLLDQIARRFERPPGDLQGLRIADIGCGAGLMCEPLAARGAQVVGVDAALRSIAAARLHASDGGLNIDYRVGEPDVALRDGETFDVLLLLEVVEHVDNLQAFVREATRHLKPGGLLLVSTINRTARSYVTAIVGAEYIFRVLPIGTHHWTQLVRPDELNQVAQACGLVQDDCRGMRYLPVVHRAWWTDNISVNYIASFSKPSAQTVHRPSIDADRPGSVADHPDKTARPPAENEFRARAARLWESTVSGSGDLKHSCVALAPWLEHRKDTKDRADTFDLRE